MTAVCDPPCLNGGECSEDGVCVCPNGWNGDQCEKGKYLKLSTQYHVCLSHLGKSHLQLYVSRNVKMVGHVMPLIGVLAQRTGEDHLVKLVRFNVAGLPFTRYSLACFC